MTERLWFLHPWWASVMDTAHWGVIDGPLERESRDWNFPQSLHALDKCLSLSASRSPHLWNEGLGGFLPSVVRLGLLPPAAWIWRAERNGGTSERLPTREQEEHPSLSISNSTSSLPASLGCPIWQPLAKLLLCFHLSNLSGTSGRKGVKCGCSFHPFF